MSFEHDIKQLRSDKGMTQQQVADALHVSRQTVSTWERGKNYPSLDVLKSISELFDVSFEQLLFGGPLEMKEETKNVAQAIDKEVSLKGRYKKIVIVIGMLFVMLIASGTTLFVGYEKGIQEIDRFNPFLPYEVGYAKLPSDKVIKQKMESGNGNWTGWFSDNDMGTKWTQLTLTTGMNPGVKNPYVMAYHKGSYVREARIVPGDAINQLRKSNADFILEFLTTGIDGYGDQSERDELNKKTHINELRNLVYPGYMESEDSAVKAESK